MSKRTFDHELARKLNREDGLSLSEVGRRMGVTHTAIRKAVSRLEQESPTPPRAGPDVICASPECSRLLPKPSRQSQLYCCLTCNKRARYLRNKERGATAVRVRIPRVRPPSEPWTPWTPWPSSCKPVPQRDDADAPLPTRGHGTGHLHQAKSLRSQRGTTAGHSA